jgi:sugar O-acyltransferase (sialic acid O-acetyltransferase NeuD family)
MFIYGASGHGKVVYEITEALGLFLEVFVDDNEALQNKWAIPIVREIPNHLTQGVLAIGNNRLRKNIANRFLTKKFVSLVHPNANVSSRANLGSGTVVMAGATINVDVKIGSHVIVNTNASVDHDCILEDFVHVSPNVALSGGVIIGEGTHIGIGACIIPGVKIGKWVIVGAGAVILKDIPDYAVVVGNPGKIIKNTFDE